MDVPSLIGISSVRGYSHQALQLVKYCEIPLGQKKLPMHPAGRSLNSFWRERSNKSCHTEELLPAAILVITRVISMKIGLNVLNIPA